MAKQAAKTIDLTYVISLEEYLTNVEMNITQEAPVVTAFADAGPRRVVGNYDYTFSIEGQWDNTSALVDEKIFSQVGAAATAIGFDPTGQTAGSSDPNYDGSVILTNYTVRAAIGQAVTFSAAMAGASALARNVA